MKIRRFSVGLVLLGLCPVVLGGCGSGASTHPASSDAAPLSSTGRAVLKIRWPDVPATRLIPRAAQSIHVILVRGESTIAQQVVTRPPSGNSVVTFENLPVDTLSVRAAAYPTTDATGIAQAYGVAPATVAAGDTSVFSLTLSSTIDHLELDTNPVQLVELSKTTVTATARSASGDIVLTAPDQLTWSGSDSTFSVDGNGVVTALTGGDGTLTVTDQESGKAVSVPINVAPITVTITPITPIVSVRKTIALSATVAGNDNQKVTWKVEESGSTSKVGSVSSSGMYTAPNAAGTFHVIASSIANPVRTARVEIVVQSGSAGGTIN